MRRLLPRFVPLSLVLALLSAPGCATLQSLAQLPQIDFHIDGTSDGRLAGIDLDRVRRVDDLRATDLVRLGAAVATRRVPLRFQLHVGADNPSANRYDLHLERLEWTLLLEDRETV